MLKNIAMIICVFSLLLAGCTPAATQTAPMQRNESFSGGMDGFAAPQEAPAGGEIQHQVLASERLVIQDAALTIVVNQPADAMTSVRQMAEEMGGFVVDSRIYKIYVNDVELPEATITVRVPSARFNEALERVKGLTQNPAEDVKAETVSGQDVTKEYTDLRSRLKNLQETENQLREIMKSATKTEDVLSIQRELTSVRENIEVIQGQIQFYEEAAALSAISVTLRAQEAVKPLEVGGWQPVGVARDAVQALIDTMQFLGSAAIWLLLFLAPVGLVIFLPLRFLWWLLRRGHKPKVQAPPPPAPTVQS